MSRRSKGKQNDGPKVKSHKTEENSSEEEDVSELSIKQEVDTNISRSSSSSPTSESHQHAQQNINVITGLDNVAESLEAPLLHDVPVVNTVPSRNLPAVNVPEKIVLCIDTSEDPNYTPFKFGNGTTHPPLYMIKRIVEIFLHGKKAIDKRHEFALAVLHGKHISWVRDFTGDIRAIIQDVEKLSTCFESSTFDLTLLFNILHKHIRLPEEITDPITQVPSFVSRVILIYNRSTCVPEFIRGKESYNLLTSSLYFTLDVLYIHEEQSEDNRSEEIYKTLVNLSQQGISYFFDTHRNATTLHNNMAKLLAHPLQRHPQEIASYKFDI